MQKKCAFVLSLLVVAMTLPCQAQPASEQEKNKTVARTFFEEVLGQGKLEKYSESHTADFVGHGSERDFTCGRSGGGAGRTQSDCPTCSSRSTTWWPRKSGRGALDGVGHEHSAGNGASCDRQTGQGFRNDPVPLQGGKNLGRMGRLEHALGAEAGRPTVPSETYEPRQLLTIPITRSLRGFERFRLLATVEPRVTYPDRRLFGLVTRSPV